MNAIAPIMTEPGGAAWRQTIFWPFAQMSRYGQAACCARKSIYQAIRPVTSIRAAPTICFPVDAPYLKLAAVRREDGGLNIFAPEPPVLRGTDAAHCPVAGFGGISIKGAEEL